MTLDTIAIGAFIRERRVEKGCTQAELAERLGVSAQAVSNWERGETTPDIALLPDLACILDCSVDTMLGGGKCIGKYRRRITVAQMREAVLCVRRMRELLGSDHFMYRCMADALDERMNSSIEPALYEERILDAYVCEALLECVKRGDYVDADDVRGHIGNEKAREFTLGALRELGLK
ncbi:MAG: helix-turn-helix transcriptional regulator [Eubacteriales bacterium]|nr:helix-turn-helix transcriptional regulator [Eubacteriales bacterium]